MARFGCVLLAFACLAAPSLAVQAPAVAPAPAANESDLNGSRNLTSPCYGDPSALECVEFERSDEDWTDDLTLLCSATPYLVGCYLWEQCQSGIASGTHCTLSSLTANVCLDMPLINSTTAGCEAWSALCGGEGTGVAQCTSPGPVSDIVNSLTTRDGINSICLTHYMPGCECGPHEGSESHSFSNCTFPGPLPIFAYMCYAMPDMPECEQTGFKAMCSIADVADTFPAVCVDPPNPAEIERIDPPSQPTGAPQPAAAEAPAAAPLAQAPVPAPAPSAGWASVPSTVALLLAIVLGVLALF